MTLVVLQALTALWFYRLFRTVDAFSAVAILVFGMVNAIAQLGNVALLASALDVTPSSVGAARGDDPTDVCGERQLVGSRSSWLRALVDPDRPVRAAIRMDAAATGVDPGRRGTRTCAQRFVSYLSPDAGVVARGIVVPASVGEFWMIGYLLVRGVRRTEVLSNARTPMRLKPRTRRNTNCAD